MPPTTTAVFSVGEKVLAYDEALLYHATVLQKQNRREEGSRKSTLSAQYWIHYEGWDDSWDTWLPTSRLLKCTDTNLAHQAFLNKQVALKERSSTTRGSKRRNDGEKLEMGSTLSMSSPPGDGEPGDTHINTATYQLWGRTNSAWKQWPGSAAAPGQAVYWTPPTGEQLELYCGCNPGPVLTWRQIATSHSVRRRIRKISPEDEVAAYLKARGEGSKPAKKEQGEDASSPPSPKRRKHSSITVNVSASASQRSIALPADGYVDDDPPDWSAFTEGSTTSELHPTYRSPGPANFPKSEGATYLDLFAEESLVDQQPHGIPGPLAVVRRWKSTTAPGTSSMVRDPRTVRAATSAIEQLLAENQQAESARLKAMETQHRNEIVGLQMESTRAGEREKTKDDLIIVLRAQLSGLQEKLDLSREIAANLQKALG